MTNDIIPCPICDGKKKELYDWHRSQLEALQRDFHERMLNLENDFHEMLLALAEAHANGEHDERRSDAEDSG